MIQQKMMMSRDTRKLLNKLDDVARENGIMALHTINHIYKAEQLMLKYYYNPVSNLLDARMSCIKNKSSKHCQIDYWISIIDRAFQNNSNVCRENNLSYSESVESFQYISSYLITDYSIYDSKLIHDIMNMYSANQIKEACKVGIKYNVYNVQYINAVLQNIEAQENIKINKINEIAYKTSISDDILYQEKHHNLVSDVASMSYEWDNIKENAEIEKKFKEMFGE